MFDTFRFDVLIFVVMIGASIGSFFTMLFYRWPTFEGFSFWEKIKGISTRSHCPQCHHVLGVLDLFPIFSYIFSRARCRYCHNRIPFRYLRIELLTMFSFVLVYLLYVYG